MKAVIQENLTYSDIDITDVTILEQQINYSRKVLFDLIQVYGKVQNQMLEIKKQQLEKKNEIRSNVSKNLTKELEEDDEYMELSYQYDAYVIGIKIIEEQIDMVKSDIRILSSSMYRKF